MSEINLQALMCNICRKNLEACKCAEPVRQCGTCATGIDEEDRYDQVRCNNPKSSNYDGNVEATDVCDQWQHR
jgi:hypothetical protein